MRTLIHSAERTAHKSRANQQLTKNQNDSQSEFVFDIDKYKLK